MNRMNLVIVIALLAIVPAMFARAQDPPAPKPAPELKDQDMGKLIETVMAARLAKKLELSDEQTVVMCRHLFDFKDQIAALRKQRQEMVKKLKGALQAAEPDAQIQAKLDELVAQDAKIADLRKTMFQEASKGLSVAQKAKLYVFVAEFESDLRQMIQKARQGLAPGGTPPAGPQTPRWQRFFGGGRNKAAAPPADKPLVP